ncbi:hypothetical protein Q1695_008250 [Nippostrongylus brasiliensis]|nr:hypothetical protein Q1695_008250 [Nippostrongylus brasiliensis]
MIATQLIPAVLFIFLLMSQASESNSVKGRSSRQVDQVLGKEKEDVEVRSGEKLTIDRTVEFPPHRKRHQNGHHHCRHIHHC